MLVLIAVVLASQPPSPMPGPARSATTTLMQSHAGNISASASTTWPGWGPERLIDGDPETSWFSADGDAAAFQKKPWVEVGFPAPVDVKKVTLLGNREPAWPKGFTIRYGKLELLDAKRAVLATMKNEGANKVSDVSFAFKRAVSGVVFVRFTSLMDEGDHTSYRDIALAEVLVE